MTKMTELFARQGVATRTDNDWLEYAEAKRQRREKNLAAAHEVLHRNHIAYQECDDHLFMIHMDNGVVIHYYPPTGEWNEIVGTRLIKRGFGIRNLVRHIKGEVL